MTGATSKTAGPLRLGRLMDGYLSTQLLFLAARLGIADELAAGPRTAGHLAAAVGRAGRAAGPGAARAGRGRGAGRAAGRPVRADRDRRVADARTCRARCATWRSSAASSISPPRSGCRPRSGPGAPRSSRCTASGSSTTWTRTRRTSGSSPRPMAGRADREAADLVAAYDFGGIRHLVDVGGGYGVLVGAVLRATPGLTATLVERAGGGRAGPGPDEPRPGWPTGARWSPATTSPPCRPAPTRTCCPGCCTTGPTRRPAGSCATCRKAVPSGARLLVAEALLPDAGQGPAGGDPDGPHHAHAVRGGPGADRGRVSRAARRRRLRRHARCTGPRPRSGSGWSRR